MATTKIKLGKLVLSDERSGWMVVWTDESGDGAFVGQDANMTEAQLKTKLEAAKSRRDWDTVEYMTVELAARDPALADDVVPRRTGYACDTRAAANRFIAHLRAAQKVARDEFETGKTSEDWEVKALAAGWKPPKGWKLAL